MQGIVARLARAGCVAAEAEAAELVAAVDAGDELDAAVARRERGEPLAWITGATVFAGHRIAVDPGVYVPRPQTQELARRAATLLAAAPGPRRRAADLCTGSGAVAHHLVASVPGAEVVGLDLDERAVRCARRNGVAAVRADAAAPPLPARTCDVVTAVAPYVPTASLRLLPADVQRYEPRRALDGGADGLDVVRAVVTAAAHLLRPDGWLLAEVGGRQDEALVPVLAACGFDAIVAWRDDDEDLRGVVARRLA